MFMAIRGAINMISLCFTRGSIFIKNRPMKIDYKKVIKDQFGNPVPAGEKSELELTIKYALDLVFWTRLPDEALSPDQLYTLGKIRHKIRKEKDLDAGEITKAIDRCAKVYTAPAIFTQIYETLNGIKDEDEVTEPMLETKLHSAVESA